MAEKTAAQIKAQKAYMSKFSRVGIRMTPDERDAIQSHAKEMGESVNTFVMRAISETMERDGEA